MNDKFSRMLHEDIGLLSGKEDALIEMMEALNTMKIECEYLAKRVENYLDDMGEMPVNHELELPSEFVDAHERYQELLEEIY